MRFGRLAPWFWNCRFWTHRFSLPSQGAPDSVLPVAHQPQERAGWVRKLCGRGMFRDLWRNRFLVLRGERLYISDKEVRP